MNAALAILAERAAPVLEPFGGPAGLSSLLLTPRYTASRHVVVLLVPRGDSEPALVAKIPRLAGDSAGVAREHAALRAVQALQEGGCTTVPRVVAYEERGGRHVLVETALAGTPLSPEHIRRNQTTAVETVVAWLRTLPATEPIESRERFTRLLQRPLELLDQTLGPEDGDLVARTLELLEPLRTMRLPSVVEHGDLSHPNLLLLRSGELGVVDWELAELDGLPAHDLFVFLAYAAAAQARASTPKERTHAFHDAVLRPGTWGMRVAVAHARERGLEAELLTPLLVACWARYTAGLLVRLLGDRSPGEERGAAGLGAEPAGRNEVARLVRADRHYAFWRRAVTTAPGLNWDT